MLLRRSIVLCIVLGALLLVWLKWRDSSPTRQHAETAVPTIVKEPVNFASRTFDPATPPPDMPPLPSGENAECDSNFVSNAIVGGQTRQTDSTHAILTLTQVKVTLQLNLTIWVPVGVTQHVLEHEEGHRQISESYYQSADQIAARIAATYLGRQFDISGTDLHAKASKLLEQTAAEITDKYDKQLNPEPTQLLYDRITEHSRNDVVAADAVAHALNNVAIESPPPPSNPEN